MSRDPQTSRIAVLLFTDMVDSVALEHKIGTEDYSRLLQKHHQIFGTVLSTVGSGHIHMDTGDGFLAEFTTAAHAVNAALLFQMLLRESKWDVVAPKVRIGIHQGQLAEIQMDKASPGKIVGIPVSIASRVMSMGQGSQILMTRSVFDDARQFVREHPASLIPGRQPPALKWKSHGLYNFKGTDSPIEVYEVGAAGSAPLSPPTQSEKARRADSVEAQVEAPRREPRPWLVAGITAAFGLLLLTPVGDSWVNASYDYLWRFGSHAVTNKVALILMDKDAYTRFHQIRPLPWDRAIHAKLLNKLAADGCPLIVMDIFFPDSQTNSADLALSEAMKKCSNVVLMAEQSRTEEKDLNAASAIPPAEPFLSAVKGNWGAGYFDGGVDQTEIVRKHWPFPSPGPYPSLSWAAAKVAGATLSDAPAHRWLRYYGEKGPWLSFGYYFGLEKPAGFFRDTVVFIGNKPESAQWDDDRADKFRTPYTKRTGDAVGGIELHATSFLNLMNRDWLKRLHWSLEAGILLILGAALGYVLSKLPWILASGVAVGVFLLTLVVAVVLNHIGNTWFPWLVFAGGQIPCALVMAVLPLPRRKTASAISAPGLPTRTVEDFPIKPNFRDPSDLPEVPEYDLITPHFGEGGFGKVWLAKNAVGQWQAVKAVYLSKFDNNLRPYESEFNALTKYKPVSEKHPGLLRIELISRKKDAGYFYYVMELGDSQDPRWQENPILYKPRDLESVRRSAPGGRLSSTQALRFGATLCEALHFLHLSGLTHRDIKPSNIIFVKGSPKLADIGLVTEARPQDLIRTWAGTAAFAPPAPEKPGTVQADIYALGLVLYVIGTGREPDTLSPEISAPFIDTSEMPEFMKLRSVILKACAPDPKQRFRNASEMRGALTQSLPSPRANQAS